MKYKYIVVITIAIILIPVVGVLAFLPSYQAPVKNGSGNSRPPEVRPLWDEPKLASQVHGVDLGQFSGDIEIEGLGELLSLRPIPDDDWSVLVVDWEEGIVAFHIFNLRSRQVTTLGGISLDGVKPQVEVFRWPHALLQASDNNGNFSWVLVDIEEMDITWEHNAWVPEGLRRRPVWHNGDSWYLGPVAGPVITDILKDETIPARPQGSTVNPTLGPWPPWAGGVNSGHWYLYPVVDGGGILLDIKKGTQQNFRFDQDLVWNPSRERLAWRQDGKLGLVDTQENSKVAPIPEDLVPGMPLWSATGNKLFFIGGDEDFFGTTWNSLWVWDLESDPEKVFSLPGAWARWRLLAATDDSVLAAAGENAEQLVYFDIGNEKKFELKGVRVGGWVWQHGTLVAISEGEMVRVSSLGRRALGRDEVNYRLLGIVNQFLFYLQDDMILIKQLTM